MRRKLFLSAAGVIGIAAFSTIGFSQVLFGSPPSPGFGTQAVVQTEESQDVTTTITEEPMQEPEASETEEPEESSQSSIGSLDWDVEDAYLLAKIAMAEAEDQDTEGKALVILVVLNRVWDGRFPDTISEVIYQENQFSPVASGRFDSVEPDADCYDALQMVESGWDESRGALYFESRSESTWHEENLLFLFKYGDHYFYTEEGI